MKTCAKHDGVALSIVCKRCGDFTCPTCARSQGAELCLACLDRVPLRLTLRLRDWKPGGGTFPPQCPTCGDPAEVVVFVEPKGERAAPVPWPHCARCAADDARARSALRWVSIPYGVLAAGALLALRSKAVPVLPVLIAVAAASAVAAVAYFRIKRSFVPRPGARVFGAGAVKVTIERHLPLLTRYHVVTFEDGTYARAFALLNEKAIAD